MDTSFLDKLNCIFLKLDQRKGRYISYIDMIYIYIQYIIYYILLYTHKKGFSSTRHRAWSRPAEDFDFAFPAVEVAGSWCSGDMFGFYGNGGTPNHPQLEEFSIETFFSGGGSTFWETAISYPSTKISDNSRWSMIRTWLVVRLDIIHVYSCGKPFMP